MHSIDHKLLKALSVVVQQGGFKKASDVLHISQSAVSHRIKLLEDQIGQVLLTRDSPPIPTISGQHMIKHYQQIQMLEANLFKTLEHSPEESFTTFVIGLNADSLATWFLTAVESFLKEERVLLDVLVDDQEHTLKLLNEGKVSGCISADPEPVQGCSVEYLGSIHYHLLCSPEFRDRWFPEGLTLQSVGRAPMLVYSRKDKSHEKLIGSVLGEVPKRFAAHYIPIAEDQFIRFVSSGTACGMCDLTANPKCISLFKQGKLVDLAPGHSSKMELYWHSWNLKVGVLDTFSQLLVKQVRNLLQGEGN